MPGQLEIPILNPLKWVSVNPENASYLYYTKFREDYLFEQTQYDWQEFKRRIQPWVTGDNIYQQFTSNYSPLLIQVKDVYGNILLQSNAAPIRANKYVAGSLLYEHLIQTSALPIGGPYQARLIPGGDTTQEQMSEWFCVGSSSKNTVRIDYRNNRFHGDVVFETGIVFTLRMPGFFDEKEPASLDTIYQDQDLDTVLLSSKPSSGYTFYLGDGSGIPPWMAEKVNFALSCSNTSFDSKLMGKAQGTAWKRYDQEGTRVYGYSIDLQPGLNRASRIINASIDPTKKISLVYNLDQSAVFGSMAPTNGNIVFPITALE